jgi:endonuclease/exonuclease/phosphatase (EEP) superfamily protein YafD
MNKNVLIGFSFSGLLQVACLGVIVCSVAPLLTDLFWLFDLLANFRVQYALLCLLFLIGFVITKHKIYSVVALAGLLLNSYHVVPFVFSSSQQNMKPVNTLKLFHANVYTGNQQHGLLINQLKEVQADVVILQEVDHLWLQSLSVLNDEYPHRLEIPRSDNFGLTVFSRFPFDSKQIHNWTLLDIPSIEFTIRLDNHPVNIITTHPPPPINRYYFYAIAQQFKAIAKVINSQPNLSHVVIGDLNTTMWSKHYKILAAIPNFKNANKEHGFKPTWPTHLKPFMIPIDHCLVTDRVEVLGYQTGNGIGSDHLPLIVELGF